jgi:sigma-B regulation protein RsbU (phosphoserine phosphatase)
VDDKNVSESQNPSVVASQEENRRLRRAVEELSVLNDLARAIGASLNLQDIMQTIIHRSLRAIHAEQGVITIVDQAAGDSMKTLVRTMVSSSSHPQYHFNQSLLGWMYLNKKPLLVTDPTNDDRFRGVQWETSVRSLLCVPMIVKSKLIAVLTAYNKRQGAQFSDEDQRLLAIIAAQSAQVLENARLAEDEKALQRMREEVRLASKIQEELLPKVPPKIAGYDIAGASYSAQVVGGDYFDFIPAEGNRLAVTLGDVSGKGLPASLLMANVQATLRGQTLLTPPANICLQRSNTLLYRSTSSDKFVTLFYGLLDPVAHTLTYANAGHDSPKLLGADGNMRRLEAGGVVLSILEHFPYEEALLTLAPGDLLVLYSDGVTEAGNTQQEFFGEPRLMEVIRQHRNAPAVEIIEHIVAAVRAHAGAADQTDDITLVVVKRLES